MADKKKLVFMVTHGPENPELATIPFVMAATALASDIEVIMGFVGNGAFLVLRGMAERVAAPGFPPLKELLDIYTEGGGRLYVCGPCVGARQIKDEELIDGAAITGSATFVAEYATAANVVVY